MGRLTLPWQIAGPPHGYFEFWKTKKGGGDNLEINNLADPKDLRLSDERLRRVETLSDSTSLHPPKRLRVFVASPGISEEYQRSKTY
jgi:hypothetical protein